SAALGTNGSRLAIQYNKESSLTLSQDGAMVSRKTLRQLTKLDRDMVLLEAKEAHELRQVTHRDRIQRMLHMMEEDPLLAQRQKRQHIGMFMVRSTHNDHPQQV